jgi:hypothetical protein
MNDREIVTINNQLDRLGKYHLFSLDTVSVDKQVTEVIAKWYIPNDESEPKDLQIRTIETRGDG